MSIVCDRCGDEHPWGIPDIDANKREGIAEKRDDILCVDCALKLNIE